MKRDNYNNVSTDITIRFQGILNISFASFLLVFWKVLFLEFHLHRMEIAADNRMCWSVICNALSSMLIVFGGQLFYIINR